MSKVDTYVENIFAGLPHTRQAAAEKAALLQQMQQRYDALLGEGKTEQEDWALSLRKTTILSRCATSWG